MFCCLFLEKICLVLILLHRAIVFNTKYVLLCELMQLALRLQMNERNVYQHCSTWVREVRLRTIRHCSFVVNRYY